MAEDRAPEVLGATSVLMAMVALLLEVDYRVLGGMPLFASALYKTPFNGARII